MDGFWSAAVQEAESKTVPMLAEQNTGFHQVRPRGNALLVCVHSFRGFPPLGKGLGSREESIALLLGKRLCEWSVVSIGP